MLLALWVGCTSGTPDLESPDLQAVQAAPVAQQAPPGAPNVLLISLDTVRPDHTSVYGYDRDTTPRLAAVAKQGAVFEHAYAQAPSTSPTAPSGRAAALATQPTRRPSAKSSTTCFGAAS